MSTLLVAFVTLALCLGLYLRPRKKSSVVYPPGPKPHPVVGHTFQVPEKKAYLFFEELGKKFGSIIKLSLGGDEILVLNDPKDAEELLGRRSQNYSSRKPLVYAGHYLSNYKRMVILPYGNTFKKQRQAFYQMLQPRVVGSYETMQVQECGKLLYDMMHHPKQANINAKRFTAELVFMMSYGRHLSPDDSELKTVLKILDDFIGDCYPGQHLVDTFPILDSWWVPDSIATWRKEAKAKHEIEAGFYKGLLFEVKDRMDNGDGKLECFAARLWDQEHKLGLDVESLAYVAGSAFEAGTGPTSGALLFFIMAMALYPEIMRKAQDEIDALLGENSDNPPSFEHIDHLPYVVALCKEVFRWIPVAPGGFPHHSDKDDEYKGYKINAGTTVISNIWAMHHSPDNFDDPLIFKPERYLRKDEDEYTEHDNLIEGHWAFGFGRRACPGKYMGAKTVYIGIVQLLWAFRIEHARNANGNIIPFDTNNVTNGINMEPEEFAINMIPRTDRHRAIIERLYAEREIRRSAEAQAV